jgi:hypothetical protein
MAHGDKVIIRIGEGNRMNLRKETGKERIVNSVTSTLHLTKCLDVKLDRWYLLSHVVRSKTNTCKFKPRNVRSASKVIHLLN